MDYILRQYRIMPLGSRTSVGNIFLSEVVESGDRYDLHFLEFFVGYVWKRRATVELCELEQGLDAQEAAAAAKSPETEN